MAVLVAGDEHLHEAEDGAPVGRRLEVEGRAEEEERERGDHEHDGHGEADDPAPGLLDVDDDGGREHDGEAQHRVVPVEEGLQRPHVPGAVVPLVQLVGAERQRARPDAARPEGHERERREQQRQLPRHHHAVHLPRRALRGPLVHRQERRQPQQAHPLIDDPTRANTRTPTPRACKDQQWRGSSAGTRRVVDFDGVRRRRRLQRG